MLRFFGQDTWIVDGPSVSVAGFAYPTRMIVIRLSDGALFIWSPTAITNELQAAVDELGAVRHIVAPNTLHYKLVEEWHRAYPDAKLHALPELRAERPEFKWDIDLGEAPADAWSSDIDQVIVRGNRITTEVVFFHRHSRTAIFTDLLQQFEPGWFKGWRAIVAKLDLLTSPELTVPRKFRVTFSDRKNASGALRRILIWPTDAVLAAHAPPVTRDGRDVIARAFAWLLRG